MTTLITQSMLDEYSRLLKSKGREEARRFVFIRLQMEHNRQWMAEYKEEIEKILAELPEG